MFVEDNMSFEEEYHAIHIDALVIMACLQDEGIVLWGSFGCVLPEALQHCDQPLFHFGLQDLLYLHFAVGTFGNDCM